MFSLLQNLRRLILEGGELQEPERREMMRQGAGLLFGVCGLAVAGLAGVAAVRPTLKTTKQSWVEVGTVAGFGSKPQLVTLEADLSQAKLLGALPALVYVYRPSGGLPRALSARCTHMGCYVDWEENQDIFSCPCHQGRFDYNGRPISGPPKRALESLPTRVEGDRLLVRLEEEA